MTSDISQAVSRLHTHSQNQYSFTEPFDTNNTVHPFLCYKYPYTIRSLFISHPEQLISLAFSSIELATATFPLCFLNACHVTFST